MPTPSAVAHHRPSRARSSPPADTHRRRAGRVARLRPRLAPAVHPATLFDFDRYRRARSTPRLARRTPGVAPVTGHTAFPGHNTCRLRSSWRSLASLARVGGVPSSDRLAWETSGGRWRSKSRSVPRTRSLPSPSPAPERGGGDERRARPWGHVVGLTALGAIGLVVAASVVDPRSPPTTALNNRPVSTRAGTRYPTPVPTLHDPDRFARPRPLRPRRPTSVRWATSTFRRPLPADADRTEPVRQVVPASL